MSDAAPGTATFAFTDIEGSTVLLKQLGRDRYRDVLAEHQRLLREALVGHGGEEIDTQGDSFFFVFRRARDAVLAAADAQRALAAHSWPGGVEVQVRIGMHTGEAIRADNRYVGLSVHRAARICAAAHGGQVLVSQTTANIVEDEEEELPGLGLRDLGEQRFKSLERPVRIYQVDIDGLPRDFPPLTAADAAPATFDEEAPDVDRGASRASRFSRRWTLAGAVAVGAIAAAIAAAVSISRGEATRPTILPNSLVKIDATTNEPTAVVEIGDDPDLVVAAPPYVWVTHRVLRDPRWEPYQDEGGRYLTRVDTRTHEATVVAGGLSPCGLAADPSGDVWVASCTGSASRAHSRIVRVDAETLEFETSLEASPTAAVYRGLAYAAGSLWIANPDEDSDSPQTITRINPKTGERQTIRVGARPAGVVPYGNFVWVANYYDGTVSLVDASTNATKTIRDTGANPGLLAVGYRTLWVADFTENRVWRVDTIRERQDGSVDLPTMNEAGPGGDRPSPGVWSVAAGPRSVWATVPRDSVVWRIDPRTSRIRRIVLGHRPAGVAMDGDSVWVTVDDVD